jgi:uncharacterized protein HemY
VLLLLFFLKQTKIVDKMFGGTEDYLDDAHWANVQDPIKQMFMALTKAIRNQAAGIRDLDRKCTEFVTHDRAKGMIAQSIDKTCSKQDATQLIYTMDTKATQKEVAVLDSKLNQVIIISFRVVLFFKHYK